MEELELQQKSPTVSPSGHGDDGGSSIDMSLLLLLNMEREPEDKVEAERKRNRLLGEKRMRLFNVVDLEVNGLMRVGKTKSKPSASSKTRTQPILKTCNIIPELKTSVSNEPNITA